MYSNSALFRQKVSSILSYVSARRKPRKLLRCLFLGSQVPKCKLEVDPLLVVTSFSSLPLNLSKNCIQLPLSCTSLAIDRDAPSVSLPERATQVSFFQ